MPPRVQPVLLCRGALALQRQMAVAQPYAERRGYAGIRTVVYSDDDAVTAATMLSERGFPSVILTVIAGPDDRRLALRLEYQGSSLECCRPAHRTPKPVHLQPESNTEDLVVGMYRREVTTGSISAVLKVPLGRVRAILDRLRPRPGYHRR